MQLLFYCTLAVLCFVAWTNSYHLVVLALSCVIHTYSGPNISASHPIDTLRPLDETHSTASGKPRAVRCTCQLLTACPCVCIKSSILTQTDGYENVDRMEPEVISRRIALEGHHRNFIYEVALIGQSGLSHAAIRSFAQMDKTWLNCVYNGPANPNGHEGEYYGCYIGTHVCGKIPITGKG